jgi:hypothetical protein
VRTLSPIDTIAQLAFTPTPLTKAIDSVLAGVGEGARTSAFSTAQALCSRDATPQFHNHSTTQRQLSTLPFAIAQSRPLCANKLVSCTFFSIHTNQFLLPSFTMAPRKATATTPTRSSGRAAKAVAAAAIAKDTPKKRGRPVKAVAPAVPDPTPKKRGRPARAKAEDEVAAALGPAAEQPKKGRGRGRKAAEPVPAPVAEEAPAPKRRGRKPAEPAPEPAVQDAPAVRDAPAPKKRAGRPRKAQVEAPATPKRRGRPSASGLDLNRVAGPSRVSKRASSKKTAPPAVGTRSSPRTSRTRTRAPKQTKKASAAAAPKQKTLPKANKAVPKEAPKPKKRMGRPPKNATANPTKQTPTKPAERKTKDARVVKSSPKPRKKRGYTTIDVPDRHADAMIDYLQQLMDAEEEAKDAEVDVDIVMDDVEDVEATEDEPTNGDSGSVNPEDEEEVDVQLEDEEEPILVFEEVAEEVLSDDDDDDEPQELYRAVKDAPIKHEDNLDDAQQHAVQDNINLEAGMDAIQAAREAASDTDLDEEEPVIITQNFQDIEIQRPTREGYVEHAVETAVEDLVEDASEAFDLHHEIRNITESAPQPDPEHTFDSLFEDRVPAVSQVMEVNDPSESDNDVASSPAPLPALTSFGVAPVANMLPTAPYG